MTDEWKCPFCGSKELKVKSGNVELVGIAKDGPIYRDIESFCCLAQKQNFLHAKKNDPQGSFDPDKEAKF